MNKAILGSAEIMIRPFIEKVRKQYETVLRDQSLQKGGIQQPDSVIKDRAKKECEELQKFLLGEEEMDRIEKGFELVLKGLEKLPNRVAVLEDIKKAGSRLMEEPEESEELVLPVYETLQQMFGLSEETYDSIYSIASDFFNAGQMEEALNIFLLLTNLNNFVFEPWLGLGSCWQYNKRFPEALQAFSMASLLDFQNPLPHLLSAQVYLQIENKELAKGTLELALAKMNQNQKKELNSHIQYVKNGLKKK